jgi:chromosome segregation ATPase
MDPRTRTGLENRLDTLECHVQQHVRQIKKVVACQQARDDEQRVALEQSTCALASEEAMLGRLQTELANLRTVLGALPSKKEIFDMHRQKTTTMRMCAECAAAIADIKKHHGNCVKEYEALESHRCDMDAFAASQRSSLDELAGQLAGIEADHARAKDRQAKIRQLRRIAHDHREQIGKNAEAMAVMRKRISSTLHECETTTRNVESQSHTLEDYAANNTRLAAEVAEQTRAVADLRDRWGDAQRVLGDLHHRREQYGQLLSSLRSENEAMKASANKMSDEMRQYSEIERLSGEIDAKEKAYKDTIFEQYCLQNNYTCHASGPDSKRR